MAFALAGDGDGGAPAAMARDCTASLLGSEDGGGGPTRLAFSAGRSGR
jgi:hypothetical protein